MNGEVQDFILPLAEPNRMSDVYRNLQPMSIPLQIEKHLNFVDISEDGCMLLGSSTLNGRYWTGSVHYFSEPAVLNNGSNNVNNPEFDYNNKCLTGMNSTTVTTAGKFIDSKEKVVIGEDSGAVSILALTDVADEDGSKSTHIVVNLITYDHDDSVLSLSVSPDSKNIISGSMDRSIKVWSTDKLISQYSFRPAHTHHVSDVQYSSNSNDIFASCSLDGYALMWDIRLDKPAKVVKEGDGEGLTCVAWYPDNSCDKIFATGTNFGNVILYDVRMPFKSLTNVKVFNRPLHKLAFNSNGILAACGDTCEVKILDCEKGSSLNVIYSDKRHNGFVRGLSWHPKCRNQLYSCGWDTQVLLHNLDNKNQYNLGVENIDLNS